METENKQHHLDITCGIILRGDIQMVNELLRDIEDSYGLTVVYQLSSCDKLFISKEMN